MKVLLRTLALLALLASCSKKEDPAVATDPFLGHWQSQRLRHLDYDATGKQTKDETMPVATQLDVSATTLTFRTLLPNGAKAVDRVQYVRTGENITLPRPLSNTEGETYAIRNLSSTSFTLEYNGPRVAGKSYYTETVPYTH